MPIDVSCIPKPKRVTRPNHKPLPRLRKKKKNADIVSEKRIFFIILLSYMRGNMRAVQRRITPEIVVPRLTNQLITNPPPSDSTDKKKGEIRVISR